MADLTRIGEVLGGQQAQTPEASNRREASKNDCIVTLQEAKARGLRWRNEPPPPGKCQFCGAELPAEGIVFGNEVMFWHGQPRRCNCEQAKAYWEDYDRKEEERIRAEEEAERNRQMRNRIARLLGQSGIKKRFRQRTFPNFRTDTPGRRKCYAIAKEYADNFALHMTVKVTNGDIWKGIENGEITGLSMGGVGNYSEEDVELETVNKQQETSEKRGLLQQLAKALGMNVVEKGAMSEIYEERSKGTLFWNAMNTLEEVLYRYDNITGRWLYEADEGRVRECLEEFSQIITSILTGGESITKAIQTARPVEKAGKKMSTKNRETLQGIYDSLGSFLKEFDDPEPDDDPDKKKAGEVTDDGGTEGDQTNTKTDKEDKQVTKQEVEQIVAAAITKAMGDNGQQATAQTAQNGAGAVEKAAGGENTTPTELTPEAIEKMVQEAISKAMEPQKQEAVTAEQVQQMITDAVAKAVDPVLKSKGLPSNLGGSVTKDAGSGEQHYLHGIL